MLNNLKKSTFDISKSLTTKKRGMIVLGQLWRASVKLKKGCMKKQNWMQAKKKKNL